MSNRPNRPKNPPPSARVAEAKKAANTGSSRTMWWVGGVIAVVVVGALIVAMVAGNKSSSTASDVVIKGGGTVVPAGQLAYGDVSVTGTPLAEQPQNGGTDPAIGQTVPTVKGEQFNGTSLTIPSTGKPKVVMFVAHWCPHCQKEVPIIAADLAASGLPTDVDLYAVATSTSDTRPNFPPADWLHGANWPVPTIADNNKNDAAAAYGVGGFPFFVAVDANGKVVDRTSGEITLDQFHQLIESARTGQKATTAPAG